jgi:hypothetical protein
MNLEKLTGKKFALVAMGEDESGKKEGVVFTGIARWIKGHLYFDHSSKHKPFQLPDDVLHRVKPTPKEFKDILLDAEFYIIMSIGSLPDDADPSEYVQTGLKWPE